MLTSLGWIFIFGIIGNYLFKKLHLPGLLGMLLTGMILGPQALNWLDDSILNISGDLRKIALIIILTRVGLALDLNDLKKVGRPAFLMCWLPASLEIIGIIVASLFLLDISWQEAALMGCVIAAVSPAVIVPRMLNLLAAGYGSKKCLPQLIMAGASVDDVFVIVLFTFFTGMVQGVQSSFAAFWQLPVAILLGIICGLVAGKLLTLWFNRYHMRDSLKVIIFLSLAFMLVSIEHQNFLPFSGLIAVMATGIGILRSKPELAERMSAKFAKLWIPAEIVLFVLVGAAINFKFALQTGPALIIVILIALLFRSAGVWGSLLKTGFAPGEKLFCTLSYLPKATVQAAIGAIPLSLNLACGELILTAAVISILITAPLGAIAIDATSAKLLRNDR